MPDDVGGAVQNTARDVHGESGRPCEYVHGGMHLWELPSHHLQAGCAACA
jgi:hypothetical protein